MTESLATFGLIVELISILLFLLVVYYVRRIGKITGSFTAWNLIAAGFALIVVRRLLSFLIPYLPYGAVIKDGIVPLVLLVITFLFIAGFHKLNRAFER